MAKLFLEALSQTFGPASSQESLERDIRLVFHAI